MRKLLMATAAVLGMSFGVADAAQLYVSSPTAPGISGFFGGSTKVQPGQIAVRIDLLEAVYGVAGWGTTDSVKGNKVQPYGIIGYPRLYMGVDAMATNGLKYGLFWEIRNNSSSGFPASGTAGNPGTSGNSTGGTLFWRRDYLYVGTDQLGIVRLGQTDGPMSSFLTATFDDVATGLWNGDINDWSNGASYGLVGSFPNWPFMDVGAEYTSAKVVYLSPNFAGFDFQASYEPSSANLTDSQNCNTNAGGGFINCNNQSTSTAANDLQRRRNTLEAGIRYRGAFDGVGIGASLIGAYGGHVLPGPGNPGVGGATFTDIHGATIVLKPTTSFDNLAMGYFGANVTYLGVTVGGSIIGGQYNGQMAALPSGGTNSLAWIVGAEYTVGPFTVGGSYFKWKYQGYWTLPGAETDQGLGIGASYNLAPGIQVLAEYLYGQRYRGNFDFSQGAPGPNFNNVHTQIIGAGFKIRW